MNKIDILVVRILYYWYDRDILILPFLIAERNQVLFEIARPTAKNQTTKSVA